MDFFFRSLFALYGLACVQLAHSSLGDWKNIFITHLIIIIKSELSTFPIVVIFFRGGVGVWDGCTIKFCHLLYIYIPGTPGSFFHYWCAVYGVCKWSDTFWPVGRVRLSANYTISLSSLCRLIWRHWTTKMLVRYMLPSVSLRFRQLSQLFLAVNQQLLKRFSQSVCLLHPFHYVPIIVSSWNFQELLPLTKVMSMQKVEVWC